MEDTLLNSSVVVFLASEGVLFLMLLLAFFVAIKILLKWDFDSHTREQFALEKRAYLVVTIIFFIAVIKFFLLPYFVFTIDGLSAIVAGAMCGAGVISANSYGLELLFLKILVIFTLIVWIMVNHQDIEAKNYPYFKLKLTLFLIIALLIMAETLLDFLYFINIEPNRPVSCCSALFGELEGANPLPFGLTPKILFALFIATFFSSILSLLYNQKVTAIISLMLFLYTAYYSIIYIFGLYIYELPTHKCPFCMLQSDYFYVGYLIWGGVFGGVFIGVGANIVELLTSKELKRAKRLALTLLLVSVAVSLFYPLRYYFVNGVLFDI
jgi:hypothetical protein